MPPLRTHFEHALTSGCAPGIRPASGELGSGLASIGPINAFSNRGQAVPATTGQAKRHHARHGHGTIRDPLDDSAEPHPTPRGHRQRIPNAGLQPTTRPSAGSRKPISGGTIEWVPNLAASGRPTAPRVPVLSCLAARWAERLPDRVGSGNARGHATVRAATRPGLLPREASATIRPDSCWSCACGSA